jgi:hypothetical protein
MTTVGNGVSICKAKKKTCYGRNCKMVKKEKVARTEEEVLKKVSDWCREWHDDVKVQKLECEKLIESTGEKKIIDATLIGCYNKKARSGAKRCLIAELEFEEHKQKKYSILKDMTKITALLRKLDYWRNDIPQYWVKIDKEGIPFMINYKHIWENRGKLEKMEPYAQYRSAKQITRIVAAEREDKVSDWPKYVIIGWDSIFKELGRIIRLAGFNS